MWFLFTQVSCNRNGWDLGSPTPYDHSDVSQLCGHFPALTIDRVPSREAFVFSIPSHRSSQADARGSSRLLSSLHSMTCIYERVSKEYFLSMLSENSHPYFHTDLNYIFIHQYPIGIFLNTLWNRLLCNGLLWCRESISTNFTWTSISWLLSRYGVVSCLSCLLPSKVDTLDSGHDIKLGPSAGAEHSHLRCVQLCSSVRAEGAQSWGLQGGSDHGAYPQY